MIETPPSLTPDRDVGGPARSSGGIHANPEIAQRQCLARQDRPREGLRLEQEGIGIGADRVRVKDHGVGGDASIPSVLLSVLDREQEREVRDLHRERRGPEWMAQRVQREVGIGSADGVGRDAAVGESIPSAAGSAHRGRSPLCCVGAVA